MNFAGRARPQTAQDRTSKAAEVRGAQPVFKLKDQQVSVTSPEFRQEPFSKVGSMHLDLTSITRSRSCTSASIESHWPSSCRGASGEIQTARGALQGMREREKENTAVTVSHTHREYNSRVLNFDRLRKERPACQSKPDQAPPPQAVASCHATVASGSPSLPYSGMKNSKFNDPEVAVCQLAPTSYKLPPPPSSGLLFAPTPVLCAVMRPVSGSRVRRMAPQRDAAVRAAMQREELGKRGPLLGLIADRCANGERGKVSLRSFNFKPREE
jgi:hypothetical protein